MRKCVLLMLLLGVVVFGGCSRENTRVDVIDAKVQELVGMVEQNYRGWSNRLFMARFESETLALPEKSDRVRCVRQYMKMVRSKVEMIKNPKDCILWSDDVFKLAGHGSKMMNLVGFSKEEQVETVFSVMDNVHDQIEYLQSLGPVGSRTEQLDRPHDIRNLKSQMSSWNYWVRQYIINSRTYGFNEKERTRYRARLDELMKVTRGWRDPVGAKPVSGTNATAPEVEVDI